MPSTGTQYLTRTIRITPAGYAYLRAREPWPPFMLDLAAQVQAHVPFRLFREVIHTDSEGTARVAHLQVRGAA